MSISDMIVVMKDGILQQIGKPQEVYDQPVNLFVAKFLGTPPINVFRGEVREGWLRLGEDKVLPADKLSDQEVVVGVRPEGFVLKEDGALRCRLSAVEVMGRDTSVVSTHPAAVSEVIRAIVPAEDPVRAQDGTVRFAIKPNKVFLFHKETGERLGAVL